MLETHPGFKITQSNGYFGKEKILLGEWFNTKGSLVDKQTFPPEWWKGGITAVSSQKVTAVLFTQIKPLT